MLMRETAIKHQMKSAKDVLRPFSRVMLKLISTGNQLSPDMINKDHFADWGPNISKVEAPLKLLRKAIPMPTLNTTATAWEVNLKTSIELYTIWEMTGVLKQLEGIDENEELVLWVHHLVLRRAERWQKADEAGARARSFILERASRLRDQRVRQSYLTQVPLHAAIFGMGPGPDGKIGPSSLG